MAWAGVAVPRDEVGQTRLPTVLEHGVERRVTQVCVYRQNAKPGPRR
jgi:hypothetical protein